MPLILNIDTATDTASVCISDEGIAMSYRENLLQKEHASFVHKAIKEVLAEAGKDLKEVDAYAVTSGPGSYTGLRVGLATAKGFCYAMRKPLITVNTLEVMLQAALTDYPSPAPDMLYCPMIDARRSEVYTALYNGRAEELIQPVAMVLHENSFDSWLAEQSILFFGSGSEKTRKIIFHANAVFAGVEHSAKHLGVLSHQEFVNQAFADLAYAEPEYLKDFYSGLK